jgi:dienelactone hydrolase
VPSSRPWVKALAFLVILATQAGVVALVFAAPWSAVTTESVFFAASSPTTWDEQDPAVELHGRFYYPPSYDPESEVEYPGVLLFHGAGRTLEDNHRWALELASRGAVCLGIDFRGHGDSGGDFNLADGTTYNVTFGDANGAYRHLLGAARVNSSRVAALGHSLGGGASYFLAVTERVNRVVLFYPGSAYVLGSTPLYELSAPPGTRGLILQSLDDDCGRCNPDYTRQIVGTNPGIEVTWFDGDGHGMGTHYWQYVDLSIAWLTSELCLREPPLSSPQLGLVVGFGFILLDCSLAVVSLRRSRGPPQGLPG